MSTHHDHEDQDIARLLTQAGPREAPPPEDVAAALAAARFAWERRTRERRGSRRPAVGVRRGLLVAVTTLAAATLLVLGIRLLDRSAPPTAPTLVASVDLAVGPLQIRDGDGWSAIGPGSQIPAGVEVRTGSDGRASMHTTDGVLLRFDRSTRFALESTTRIDLATGSVYADTNGAGGLVVATAIGEARDVGTRFSVRLEGETMRVGVRDGAVVVQRGDESFRADRGVELRVAREGAPLRGQISAFSDAWTWTHEVAPTFELEGSTLAAFLDWLERETGWTVSYDERSVGEPASDIVLHGSLEGVSPLDAPALVLPGAEVSYRLENGVLIVQ